MGNFEELGGDEHISAELRVLFFMANLGISRQVSMSGQQEPLYQATKGLAEYCHDETVRDVVFVDCKARPAWPGLTEYWRLAYPDEDRPEIHFLDSAATSNPWPGRFFGTLLDKMMAYNTAKQMQASRSSLYANREKKVLLFDACAHSGKTMDGLTRTLGRVGFSDVKTAVFTDDTKGRSKFDFAFTEDPDLLYCNPVGCDEKFKKSASTIYVDSSKADPVHLAEHRNRIRDIIINGFNAENKSPEHGG